MDMRKFCVFKLIWQMTEILMSSWEQGLMGLIHPPRDCKSGSHPVQIQLSSSYGLWGECSSSCNFIIVWNKLSHFSLMSNFFCFYNRIWLHLNSTFNFPIFKSSVIPFFDLFSWNINALWSNLNYKTLSSNWWMWSLIEIKCGTGKNYHIHKKFHVFPQLLSWNIVG